MLNSESIAAAGAAMAVEKEDAIDFSCVAL
jgi:hypothetical protein